MGFQFVIKRGDGQTISSLKRACCYRAGAPLKLDETEAAASRRGQTLMETETGDVKSVSSSDSEDILSCIRFDLLTIDCERYAPNHDSACLTTALNGQTSRHAPQRIQSVSSIA